MKHSILASSPILTLYFKSLIQAEITRKDDAPISVSFHGAQEPIEQAKVDAVLTTAQWAQSTELGDFVQEAAQDSKFVIALHKEGQAPQVLPVRVPTFEQRTMHLRNRLREITAEMQSLLEIKTKCDVRQSRYTRCNRYAPNPSI